MPCPEKFRDSLVQFDVEPEIRDAIWEGYETLVSSSPKPKKAAFFERALAIMDERMAPERVRDVLEWSACCKSGARDRASKEFARINAGLPLAKRLEKIARAPYMNMGRPSLGEDGRLRIDAVSYVYEGRYACACPNFRRVKREMDVSAHYCYCCGGHFKYHYEIMLGVKLAKCEILSSPLDSGGASPCAFSFAILPE